MDDEFCQFVDWLTLDKPDQRLGSEERGCPRVRKAVVGGAKADRLKPSRERGMSGAAKTDNGGPEPRVLRMVPRPGDDGVLTPTQVAEVLKKTPRTVYRMLDPRQNGGHPVLPFTQVGNSKRVLRSDLDAYLQRNRVE